MGEDSLRSVSKRHQNTVLRPQQRRRSMVAELLAEEAEKEQAQTEEEKLERMFSHRDKPALVERAVAMGEIYKERHRYGRFLVVTFTWELSIVYKLFVT